MLRNNEVQRYLFISIGILIISTISISFISTVAAVFVFVSTSLIITVFLWMTYWRYKQIKILSHYLRQISAGNMSLDVRDNREGELSILKNDIYKMSLMLSEQREDLKKDKQKLTDAISDISHQLKTPLTSMTVMAELLSDETMDDDKRLEFTHNIRKQLERMDWLVSSLLKLSKIDAGTIQFAKERVIVSNLVDEVIASLEIPLELKDISFQKLGDREVTFLGDYNWTKEALINIMKNAIEHTPEAERIAISFKENALYTEIIIQDTGKGIAKQDIPYIFKRFYKGGNAIDGSVGIGLAMAHSIITNQHGDIEVVSEEGRGTTFTIKLYKQVI
ncbi:HAMP domain-containing histidine kinase [Oceanobacillus kimchii]|uniref:sensor histidine kinase n=1 Tax=Oceanobacillus kimchii TaxID=746691 RepID=UPI0021A8F940|nr:HAMP domain-containing sensor histidine kinase [Oceanobacillus kimchii]MCT1577654.1 HAMP domain-containing histidine kinase [Oceanobacillus kimchii]MCT2136642.1 HAMP domain-containing histidine kinase [Oceanobacillus kimchii]